MNEMRTRGKNRSNCRVHLIGAGPGDPELLTLKALRVLQAAEVVLYDRLVSEEILSFAAPGAQLVYVGKAKGAHCLCQDDTNHRLLTLAQSGLRIVRLKGGDPLIFGRGSEEALFLARHGIDCEIVPGVTAASGVAARTGIPLTHRGIASGVRFVTGHFQNNALLELDWKGLADPDTTLVIYMGLAHLAKITERLMTAGLPAETPAAAIADATLPSERCVTATLASLPDRVAEAELTAPVLFIVGRVVSLRAALHGGETLSDVPSDWGARCAS